MKLCFLFVFLAFVQVSVAGSFSHPLKGKDTQLMGSSKLPLRHRSRVYLRRATELKNMNPHRDLQELNRCREKQVYRSVLIGIRGGANLAIHASNWIGRSKTRCWITLVLSILVESVAAALTKKAKLAKSGSLFTASILMYLAALCGFTSALERIDVGLAYAIWSAVGTVIVTTAGVLFYGENMNPTKLVCLAMIIAGVMGIHLIDGH